MATFTFLALGLAALLLSAAGPAEAQNCGCRPNECCSTDGYCGTSIAYCGRACQSGACAVLSGGIAVPVESVVTAAFFNGIKSHAVAGDGCAGKNFYTLRSFLDAARANPDFAKGRSKDDSKREIAAFFAQVTHETGRKFFAGHGRIDRELLA
jgi:chitinase